MTAKVRKGRRGKAYKARPDDLRDKDPGLSGPARIGTAAECDLCGGPVPIGGLDVGDPAACLACGGLHVVARDDDCDICKAATRAQGSPHG